MLLKYSFNKNGFEMLGNWSLSDLLRDEFRKPGGCHVFHELLIDNPTWVRLRTLYNKGRLPEQRHMCDGGYRPVIRQGELGSVLIRRKEKRPLRALL